MDGRRWLSAGALALGLSLLLVAPAAGDPPPWAAARGHEKHADRDRDRDRDGDRRARRNDRAHRGDPEYAELIARRNHDRAKIAEIEPTGRNRKALQWYRDDLKNVQRDIREYRRPTSTRDDHDRVDDDDWASWYGETDEESSDNGFDWASLLGAFGSPTN